MGGCVDKQMDNKLLSWLFCPNAKSSHPYSCSHTSFVHLSHPRVISGTQATVPFVECAKILRCLPQRKLG